MKLIVGLGNPGESYAQNRHNVGRVVVGGIFNLKLKIFNENVSWIGMMEAEVCKINDLILARAGEEKYMNESGEWVGRLKNFYKIQNQDVIVVYDDLDLEAGRILVSDRGPKIHNGVNSVISAIGDGFVHVRCGVDDRNGDRTIPGVDYVLMDMSEEQKNLVIGSAIEEISSMLLRP